MLSKQIVKETFCESFRRHNLRNVIGIIGLTISDQLQIVSPFPQVMIFLGKVKGSFKKYVFKWGRGGGYRKMTQSVTVGGGGVLEFNTC